MLIEPSPTRTSGALHAQQRVGWQPSRFLADQTESQRAYQLAERLGSINAAAHELGTTWPSLRKAFVRHGLGMPARNLEAVRQRGIAAASQCAGPPAAPPLDPMFVALNPGQLPTRRGPQAEQGMRLRRAEEIETLSYRTVVELNAESRLAPQRRVATIARRPRTCPTAGRGAGWPSRPPPGRSRQPHPPAQPAGEGDGCRCPLTPSTPTSSTARSGSAPIWCPTWTACPSATWPRCWGSCPVAARSRWGWVCS